MLSVELPLRIEWFEMYVGWKGLQDAGFGVPLCHCIRRFVAQLFRRRALDRIACVLLGSGGPIDDRKFQRRLVVFGSAGPLRISVVTESGCIHIGWTALLNGSTNTEVPSSGPHGPRLGAIRIFIHSQCFSVWAFQSDCQASVNFNL